VAVFGSFGEVGTRTLPVVPGVLRLWVETAQITGNEWEGGRDVMDRHFRGEERDGG